MLAGVRNEYKSKFLCEIIKKKHYQNRILSRAIYNLVFEELGPDSWLRVLRFFLLPSFIHLYKNKKIRNERKFWSKPTIISKPPNRWAK